LREFGVVIPVGARSVLPRVTALLAAEDGLPSALHPALTAIVAELRDLAHRIQTIDQQLAALAPTTPGVAPLQTVPGIGLLTATALVAFVGDAHRFPSGRHFASYLGLTPREHSSGLRRRLGAISKRGDPYLRMLLVHGARSILWHAQRAPSRTRLHTWGLAVQQQRGHNKAAVALANKLARCAWAVWTTNHPFRAAPVAA
jgi:transposase